MSKVNSYRVSDLANAAVLVFKRPAVPVARSLQRERHHQHDHNDGQRTVSCPSRDTQVWIPRSDGT